MDSKYYLSSNFNDSIYYYVEIVVIVAYNAWNFNLRILRVYIKRLNSSGFWCINKYAINNAFVKRKWEKNMRGVFSLLFLFKIHVLLFFSSSLNVCVMWSFIVIIFVMSAAFFVWWFRKSHHSQFYCMKWIERNVVALYFCFLSYTCVSSLCIVLLIFLLLLSCNSGT